MYIFPDQNKTYINNEVDLRLSDLTAQGVVKSETEYRNLIQETLKSIDANSTRLTNASKYIVKTDNTVSSLMLNSLFTDLESDMRILHKELDDIHSVIDITLERNKLFYRRIKNRIASIWKEIQYFRENSFNIESSTYTFFESFSEDSVMSLTNLSVDKKTGTLIITPAYINTFSDSADIASVDMTLYPAANKDGGLIETTDPRNTFDYNYTKGDRTLLSNGLWKVQMLASDIPEIILDIFGRGTNKSYRGLIAQIDITFNTQKLINEINIDPYGDFTSTVLGLMYKTTNDDIWHNVVDENDNVISGSDVDWIVLRNFVPVTAKILRIIYFQPNYQIVSRLMSQTDTMVDKMVQALIEQRFEKINYQYKSKDMFPKFDKSQEADLYDEVMNIIDEGGTINSLERQITNLLIPQPINIAADIRNWKLFNMGAWAIDIQNIGYSSQSIGVYISHDIRDKTSGFKINNGCPTYARLYTKENQPSASSIEWSLLIDTDGTNYTEVPIISNNEIIRNEAIKFAPMTSLQYADSTYRTNTDSGKIKNLYNVFKLDFPIHPAYQNNIIFLENGKETSAYNRPEFEFYNSTELYVSNIDMSNGSVYSLKYVPSVLDTVKCWILIPNKKSTSSKIDFGSACVFATEQAAMDVASTLADPTMTSAEFSIANNSRSYTVAFQLCTRKEYDVWFRGGTINMFIDSSAIEGNGPDWFDRFLYNEGQTRSTWLYKSDIISAPYSETGLSNYTWNELPAAIPSIILPRIQY